MLCPNFTSSASQIIWFMVNGSQVRCVGHMFTASEPAKFCEEFQKGKFEMKSNGSTLSLTIKHVDLSDSRLYFCGFYIRTDPVLVSATFLQVQACDLLGRKKHHGENIVTFQVEALREENEREEVKSASLSFIRQKNASHSVLTYCENKTVILY
ncbi:uncharacterized protein V6R79_018686 [Siganus canaliculatus]